MTLAMATGSVLGGLLPDIDNVHSQIGSRLPVVELIVHGCQRGIRLLSGILPRKLRENVRSMTGHRGLLHSLRFLQQCCWHCRLSAIQTE